MGWTSRFPRGVWWVVLAAIFLENFRLKSDNIRTGLYRTAVHCLRGKAP